MFRHVFHCSHGRCIALATGTVFSYTARAGERLRCRGGRILLTQFDVDEDFDLGSGAEIVIQKQGLVVIEAIEATVLARDSVAGQKHLQQAVQIALAAQRRTYAVWCHFKQLFALSRQ
jgi:hypothetical protein